MRKIVFALLVATVLVACNSGASTEIIQMTTVSNTTGNAAQIYRGQLGTTAIPSVPPGSLLVRLSGMFTAGNANVTIAPNQNSIVNFQLQSNPF